MFDPKSLLTEKELTIPRTPMELARWVDDKLRLFRDDPEAEEWVLLHMGLAKEFLEEIYPLSIFVKHLYAGRSDVQCVPNLDKREHYDALIFDHSISPARELKVEITSAVDGYDRHLRMKYFMGHGHVKLWSPLSVSGTKKSGHDIHVGEESIAHADPLKGVLSLIHMAAKRKAKNPDKPQKYGQGHILIIAFDDLLWFNPEQDLAALEDFVTKNVLTLPLEFAALYLVGLSGNTFVPFGGGPGKLGS